MRQSNHKSNCVFCGADIIYTDTVEKATCVYCKNEFEVNARCANGHYVCDGCHSRPAGEVITGYCLQAEGANPIAMAQELMKHPAVKIHGPEHHFLVPAVLLTCYANVKGDRSALEENLAEARKRAKNVLGGFCGFYGSCGAAVGVGIFMSVAAGATPLSKDEWQMANLITSEALGDIARGGGPRCCKRNTFLALIAAAGFLKERLATELEMPAEIKCGYYSMNKECKGKECGFFVKGKGAVAQRCNN